MKENRLLLDRWLLIYFTIAFIIQMFYNFGFLNVSIVYLQLICILAKESPTFAAEEELKKLQAQNDELERKLRIKEALACDSKKEASNDAITLLTEAPSNGWFRSHGVMNYYEG